jgi:hypothetical protein
MSFLKAEKYLMVDEKDKEIDDIRKEFDKKHEDFKKELQITTNKQIEELKNEMEYQRQIMFRAAEIINKMNSKLLENHQVLTRMEEIDAIKNKHYRNQHTNPEEEDIIPFVKNDLSEDELRILVADAVLKKGGDIRNSRQFMEIIKELTEKKDLQIP